MNSSLQSFLEKIFPVIKNKKITLILIILLALLVLHYNYFKAALYVSLFIILGGFSKIYHRFFKSPVGVDLVFFFTIMASLVYNEALALAVAWPGIILADTIGMRFSYTSLVSLIGLTITVLISKFFVLPFIFSAILLTIIFEIIAAIMYSFIGSSPEKLMIFISTHFLFNSFMIITFAQALRSLMI